MNRSSEKNSAKIMYFLSIVLGAIVLFSADSFPEASRPYVTIGGFALLMLGLYKSTTTWVRENPNPKSEQDSFVVYENDESVKEDE